MENEKILTQNRTKDNFWKFVVAAIIFALFFDIFAYNVLFQGMPLGLNVPILIGGFYGAILATQWKRCSLKRKGNWFLLILIAAASITFVFFNNAPLLFWNGVVLLLMIGTQLCLMTGHFVEKPYTIAFIQDFCHMVFVRPFHKIGAVFTGLFSGKQRKRKRTLGVLLGLAIAIPVFALIAALLCWADPVFAKLFGDLFSWENLWTVIGWLVVGAAVVIVAASGLLSLNQAEIKREPHVQKEPAKFNLTAVYVILAAVNALLLAFAVVQILAMGGWVALPEGVTYSQYARTGFTQMCAVAVLDFALVAICSHFTQQAKGGAAAGLKALYTLLSFSTFLMLISAFARMVLYEQAYQFTRMRLYVQAFIILLAIVLIFLVIHVWKRKFPIIQATCFAVAICLIGVTYFNVDAFIAKNNVVYLDKTIQIEEDENDVWGLERRIREDQVVYLLSLSADALPYYINALDQKDFTSRSWEDFYSTDYYDSDEDAKFEILYTRSQRMAELIDQINAGGNDFRGLNTGRWEAKESLAQKPKIVEEIEKFRTNQKADNEYFGEGLFW